MQFIEAFIWVTSFLRGPQDYALIARRFAESLRRQNVLYAEVTLSIGVMIRRNQDPAANFAALREAAAEVPGVRLEWIFDAVRQWGAHAAMEVARIAVELRSPDIVAYGIGGDELGLPTSDLRPVYEYVASQGMHRLIHAGEIGGPEIRSRGRRNCSARSASATASASCATSAPWIFWRRAAFLWKSAPRATSAPGLWLASSAVDTAGYEQHPLPSFFRRGLPVTLSSDDPAMFETTVSDEYLHAHRMGLAPGELVRLAEASFQHAFLPAEEKRALLDEFHSGIAALGLV